MSERAAVIVDTSIWSAVLRRKKDPLHAAFLSELIADGRLVVLGAIRQEILSGIRERERFEMLRTRLAAFPDLPQGREDYELAAATFNVCRAAGIQGSNTDFLICAVAHRRQFKIFTADSDFALYQRHISFEFYSPEDDV